MNFKRSLTCGVFAAAALAAGCGSRPQEWTTNATGVQAQGLTYAVALLDPNAERAVLLKAGPDETVVTQPVPLGRRVVATAKSPDKKVLYALSLGDPQRLTPEDQAPALTTIDSLNPAATTRYELADPLDGIAVDPSGKSVVIYAAGTVTDSFITNPNQIVFVNPALAPAQDTNPRIQNIPSLGGGSPQRLTFTPDLQLANGPRRLLILETQRDVVLVDPDSVRPVVTLPLSDSRSSATPVVPAGIAVDPGSATRNPCLAVRPVDGDSVYLFTFAPQATTDVHANDFKINVNTVYVGGTPTDIAFVDTNRGVRLAALVPSPAHAAVLVDVGNNHTVQAVLTDGYRNMDLVTTSVAGTSGGFDQALLWNGADASSTGGVALWDLGKVPDDTATQINTAESVVTYSLSGAVSGVVDVPNQPLKILTTNNSSFGTQLYVFDLNRHTSSPLTAPSGVSLEMSSDGKRAWAFLPGTSRLARIDPSGPNVTTIPIERIVQSVFEIERTDTGKALVALHGTESFGSRATVGATVFDALAPSVRTSRQYSGLLLEGL